MRFDNAVIYADDLQFHRGGFCVENGRFANVLRSSADEPGIDLHGAYVLPGFIDIHCHGAMGFDFSESSVKQIEAMAKQWASRGVTSFVATAMTQSEDKLTVALKAAGAFASQKHTNSAVLRGVRLEGPFLSPARKGAQNGSYLRLPSIELFDRLQASAKGLLRIIDLAPELPGAIDLIEYASKSCVVSLGHSDATYEQAKAAIAAGARHITHLCNAMQPMHHRAPGMIPAAAEAPNVSAEIIGDGKHVHPGMLRLLYHAFGEERICLISDALSCCGVMNEGCMSGGQRVHTKDGLAYLDDGTIAGSSRDLFEVFQCVLRCGIPPEAAIRMCTRNPAHLIGAQDEVGCISGGKRADFIVCDNDFSRLGVYCAGNAV